VPSFVIITKKM